MIAFPHPISVFQSFCYVFLRRGFHRLNSWPSMKNKHRRRRSTWFQSNAFILLRVWGFKDCSWQKKWKWSMSIMKSDEISLFFECRQRALATKQHPGFYRPDPVLRLLCRWRKLTHTSRISSPFHLYTWIYCFIPIIPSHPYGTCPYLSDFACHWLMVWRVNGFCKRICFCTSGFYEDLQIQSMPLVRHLMSFDI